MIFDAIAALIGAIIEPIIGTILLALVGALNLFIFIIEAIGSIFVSGFNLKRIPRKGRTPKKSDWVTTGVVLLSILLVVLYFEIKDREIQFVAEDGHSLPYAEIVVKTDKIVRNERTDKVGRIEVPRFGLVSVTLADPRYVEKTWSHEELKPRLIAERTILGKGLDKIANTLLQPAD